MATLYTESEYERCLTYILNAGIDYKSIVNITEYINNIKCLKKQNGVNISLNTQKLYLVSSEWYITKYNKNDEYSKILKKEISSLYEQIDKQIKKNILSENQQKNYAEWDDILIVYNKLKRNYIRCEQSFKTFVILSLYILVCPRRLKDYALMYIADNELSIDTDKNYFIPSADLFIFNNYKTLKHYGMQKIIIPKELSELLVTYISKYKISGSLLRLDRDGLRIRLLRLFKKELGKEISVNILRHSYISYMKDSGLMTGNEHIISQIMGHSVATQCDYYKKLTDGEKKEDSVYLNISNINIRK